MKTLKIDGLTLDKCVRDAQDEQIMLTRNGKPVAMIIGLENLDQEQIELGTNDKFWQMMERSRRGPRVSQEVAERLLGLRPSVRAKPTSKPTATKAKKAVVK